MVPHYIMKSDLSAVSDSNVIFKYADDTTLLVRELILMLVLISNLTTSGTVLSLTNSSSIWTKQNKLSSDAPESSIFTILLVLRTLNSWRVISFWESFFQSNLKINSHVQYLLAQCSQRLYLLKLLCHQGMYACWSVSHCCMSYYCLAYLVCSSVLGRLPFHWFDK